MSKIYEALLRAELERAELNGNKPVSNGSSETVTVEEFPARQSQTVSQTIAPTQEARAVVVQEEAVPARQAVPGPTVSLEKIAARVWKPSLVQLPSLEERGSAVEQFRSLRSRMHEFRDLNPLKTVAISSALPQEGKSFVAANLAVSFARHKASRVLLIDGDMRRSSLHLLFGCPNEPGLTEYLSGKNTLVEVMQRAMGSDTSPLPRGLASLTFIAGGADADNAADLAGSSRFEELIRAVYPIFDWIVVDTPPVNLVADGVNFARVCDGALLIARGGVTKYEALQRALSELKASNMLGVVLNAVEKPPVTGGYYGYDSYDSKKE